MGRPSGSPSYKPKEKAEWYLCMKTAFNPLTAQAHNWWFQSPSMVLAGMLKATLLTNTLRPLRTHPRSAWTQLISHSESLPRSPKFIFLHYISIYLSTPKLYLKWREFKINEDWWTTTDTFYFSFPKHQRKKADQFLIAWELVELEQPPGERNCKEKPGMPVHY